MHDFQLGFDEYLIEVHLLGLDPLDLLLTRERALRVVPPHLALIRVLGAGLLASQNLEPVDMDF